MVAGQLPEFRQSKEGLRVYFSNKFSSDGDAIALERTFKNHSNGRQFSGHHFHLQMRTLRLKSFSHLSKVTRF